MIRLERHISVRKEFETNKCCCFTGHRPNKVAEQKDDIIKRLDAEIENAISNGFNVFISGMAQGVDVWAAERVLLFKEKHREIRLVLALPFPDFCKHRRDIEQCDKILEKADKIEIVSSHYFPAVYQVRNEWMIDHAELVLAVFDGSKGGTKNTVDYAKRKQIKVVNLLYPNTLSI